MLKLRLWPSWGENQVFWNVAQYSFLFSLFLHDEPQTHWLAVRKQTVVLKQRQNSREIAASTCTSVEAGGIFLQEDATLCCPPRVLRLFETSFSSCPWKMCGKNPRIWPGFNQIFMMPSLVSSPRVTQALIWISEWWGSFERKCHIICTVYTDQICMCGFCRLVSVLLLFTGTMLMRCSRSSRWGSQGHPGYSRPREATSWPSGHLWGHRDYEEVTLSLGCPASLTGEGWWGDIHTQPSNQKGRNIPGGESHDHNSLEALESNGVFINWRLSLTGDCVLGVGGVTGGKQDQKVEVGSLWLRKLRDWFWTLSLRPWEGPDGF